MDSSPLLPSSSSQSTPTPSPNSAAEQARLRKERREAKIKAGGSARLGKITSMGGGRPPDESVGCFRNEVDGENMGLMGGDADEVAAAWTSQGARLDDSSAREEEPEPDPEEVDISQRQFHSPTFDEYGPARGEQYQQQQQEQDGMGTGMGMDEQLRQMMARFYAGESSDAPGQEQQQRQQQQQSMGNQEPIARLLQQLIRGGSGDSTGGGGGGGGGLPPALAQMLGQAQAAAGAGGAQDTPLNPQQQQQQQQQQSSTSSSSSHLWWQVIHLVSSLALGLYIILSTSFTGSQTQRTTSTFTSTTSTTHFPYRYQPFYLFSTLELILQSTRFFLDRGNAAQPTGGFLLGAAVDFLPSLWKGRVVLGLRYVGILRTVVRDGLVLLFVLGVVGWLRGGGGAEVRG
ncbi:MAG: hypothetical protein M1816_002322 [Peltula sp. TS41687]|nr:MAG: hypothetical protein M1816_002322 [Peltula sp. TS41687]